MAATNVTDQIKVKALELLREHPEGLRYSQLVKQIQTSNSDFKNNTIQGSIWNLQELYPDQVYKPSRGLYRLKIHEPPETVPAELEENVTTVVNTGREVSEADFYDPFADWLKNDLEEVTHAVTLGGNRFRDKWGTPDVIGKNESRRSDIIKAPTEIVSVEIKLERSQLITAFGQVCSYRLFSHRVYLVVPKQSISDDIDRLDSLCQIFGIGLVIFDVNKPDLPDFRILVRAARHEPDLFYTNKYMSLVEDELFS